MGLTPINGEIQAQPLNDNFSYLNEIVHDLTVNVNDYGAVGDGSTDDTTAFTNAIAAGDTIYVPYTSAGYKLTNLTINKRLKIVGGGNRVKLIASTSTTNLIKIQSSNVNITNFFVDMNLATAGSTCFLLDTASGSYDEIRISNMRIENSYSAIKDSNSTGVLANIHFDDIGCFANKGLSITLRDTAGFIFFENVYVDNTATLVRHGINVDFAGIRIENAAGVIFSDVDIIGGTGTTGGDGFQIVNSSAIWFERCMADTVGGKGFLIDTSTHIYFDNAVSSLCYGEGFDFNVVNYLQGNDIKIRGRSDQPAPPASIDGLRARGSSLNVQINGMVTIFNTGNGITLNSSSFSLISNLKAHSNTGWGIYEASASNTNLINGAITTSNTAGNFTITGSTTTVANLIPNSGTFQNALTGPQSL